MSKVKKKTSSKSDEIPPNPDLIVTPNTGNYPCRVYIHLETLRSTSISAGAFVNLKNGVIGILTPADCDPDVVQISSALRKSAGLVYGDRVRLTKAARPPNASSVVVYSKKTEAEVKEVLENVQILVQGFDYDGVQIVEVQGELDKEMDKLSLSPSAPQIMMFEKTKIFFTENTVAQTGFAEIGGLETELNLLRSKLELPLNHPDLFERFNTAPERGFLLYGPPGTGKTMVLRSIAQETEAHIVRVDGPSLFSKYQGETESALRKVFDEAERFAPAIIFFDELDAMAPKRDSDDAGETESRLVATLLTLMDGMNATNRVVCVGATNRPNNIDPALRRAGRFGQEIEIGIPNVVGRRAIIDLKLSRMPHNLTPDDIQDIAAKSHGFVGADLTALCRDAVMSAIEKGLAKRQDATSMFVAKADFDHAFVSVRPSAMREIFLETPKIYWSDIGGQDKVIRQLRETVEWPILHKDSFERLGITPPRGLLLYGPPGCSKTLLVKALATEAGLNFLAVKGPEIFNKYVGESERAIREVFNKARATSPSIIFFDEIDALSVARGDDAGAGGDRVLTSLLNEMDGIEILKDVVIVAATNRPDVIDSALMRPGRLDRLIYVSPPDLAARRQILLIQFSKMAVDEDVDLDELAKLTEGCSGAEVVSVCQEAGLAAMNEDIDAESINQKHFVGAIQALKHNITPEMLNYFENFNSR